jgi:hypothetical protein
MTEFQIDSVEVEVGTAVVFTVWKILGEGGNNPFSDA